MPLFVCQRVVMDSRRVVIAGLGDSGVLTAIRLARHAEVVGISAKPALVSGQELGWRLSRPHDWARANWIPFDRFRGLDRVRTVHGTLTGLDLDTRAVLIRHDDGSTSAEKYDALVISTGVTNGFWRQPTFQSAEDIGTELRTAHDRLARAGSVVVVGGGAAAISSAANLARAWPDKRVDLYFPKERALLAGARPGQAGRSLLPQRARPPCPPPRDMGASPAPTRREGVRAAPRAPRGDPRRLRVRSDPQRAGPLEHRSTACVGRCRA